MPMFARPSRLTFILLCLATLSVAAFEKAAASPQHGISMLGTPALGPDFEQFPYANRSAPKGGRITFGVLDSVNRRLGQLNRATNGTGAADRYLINTDVYDGGFQVEIPESRDSYIPTTVDTTLIGKKGDSVVIPLGGLIRQGKIWYNNGTSTVTDGMGIENANTVQANFLKAL
jgi:hypothetical protein